VCEMKASPDASILRNVPGARAAARSSSRQSAQPPTLPGVVPPHPPYSVSSGCRRANSRHSPCTSQTAQMALAWLPSPALAVAGKERRVGLFNLELGAGGERLPVAVEWRRRGRVVSLAKHSRIRLGAKSTISRAFPVRSTEGD
jgi:hypothetical protein